MTHRSMFVVLLGVLLTACTPSHQVQENMAPDLSYAFVVDGYLAKTVPMPGLANEVSVVVQPRGGESPIWQRYGASYAHIALVPRLKAVTADGGTVVDLGGRIDYYRDLKTIGAPGSEEVVRGRPINTLELERRTVMIEPTQPANVVLAEGISVTISAFPKKTVPAPHP